MPDPHFEALLVKYRPVLKFIDETSVRLQKLDMNGGRLRIRAEAPSEELKARVWDEIKEIDPSFADLDAEIRVARSRTATAGGGPEPSEVYTVQPGDSLRSIAESYYGDANQEGRIFQANRDQLQDPDQIRPGQRLIIPIE